MILCMMIKKMVSIELKVRKHIQTSYKISVHKDRPETPQPIVQQGVIEITQVCTSNQKASGPNTQENV
jgi:hypothetical protein